MANTKAIKPHSHNYQNAGFCEWTSNNGKRQRYVIKQCESCDDIIEEKR